MVLPDTSLPDLGALREVQDRGEAVAAGLGDHLPAQVVVGDRDLVAVRRQTHGRGPPEIAIAPEHQNTHRGLPSSQPDGRNLACRGSRMPIQGRQDDPFAPVQRRSPPPARLAVRVGRVCLLGPLRREQAVEQQEAEDEHHAYTRK